MIELTPEQWQAAEQGEAIRVVDPTTHDAYVVIRAEVYERQAGSLPRPAEDVGPEIPPQLMRSAQAFWRDLPELLKSRRNRGLWVAYHGEERIGIAREARDLIRACVRRGIREGEYHLDVIEDKPHPPWQDEDIEYGFAEFQQESGPEAPLSRDGSHSS